MEFRERIAPNHWLDTASLREAEKILIIYAQA